MANLLLQAANSGLAGLAIQVVVTDSNPGFPPNQRMSN